MFAVLSIVDSFIIGIIVFYLIEFIFGDKPLARLSKLLLGIGSGIGYFSLCLELNYGESAADVSMTTACLVFFGPIALIAILWILSYAFKSK